MPALLLAIRGNRAFRPIWANRGIRFLLHAATAEPQLRVPLPLAFVPALREGLPAASLRRLLPKTLLQPQTAVLPATMPAAVPAAMQRAAAVPAAAMLLPLPAAAFPADAVPATHAGALLLPAAGV